MSESLIKSFGRPVTVRRTVGPGSYVDGIWVQPGVTEIEIIASVQKLTANELLLLEEGDRQKETRKFYSTFEFKAQKETTMEQSDYLFVDGKEYMVIAVDDYFMPQSMSIKYYKANAVLVNPNPS